MAAAVTVAFPAMSMTRGSNWLLLLEDLHGLMMLAGCFFMGYLNLSDALC